MNIIGIYPGTFQPPTAGNYKAYELLKKYTGNNTFVTTNDVVNLPNSPLTFQDKQQIWTRHGVPIDKIVLSKDPTQAGEVLQKFGTDRTVVVFAMPKKDATLALQNQSGRFLPFQGLSSNMEPMSSKAYILTIPDEVLYVNKQITSDTVRKAFGSKNLPEEKKKSFFKQMFGWYDISLFDLIKKKFAEAGTVKERITEGLPVNFNYDATRKSNVVAPDESVKSLINWMKTTYNMEYVSYNKGSTSTKGEYVFKRDDGREFRYTLKDLRDMGAPIGLQSLYAKKYSDAGRTVTGRGKPMKETYNESVGLPIVRRTLKAFVREILDELATPQGENPTVLSTEPAMTPAEIEKQKRDAKQQTIRALKQKEEELKTAKKEKEFQKQRTGQIDKYTIPNTTKDIQRLKGAKI